MQTGAMTMKSRMTVTEALKERELLKKRITKKIGQLGREAGTGGASAERRSVRFDASQTGRKQAQSAVSDNIGHGAVSDGTSAHCGAQLDAALQQIQALILRYDSICSAVARSNGETWLDTSRGYMTVSEAVALRSRLNESPGKHFEKTEGVFQARSESVWTPPGTERKCSDFTESVCRKRQRRAGERQPCRRWTAQAAAAYLFCTGAVEAPQSDRKDSGEQGRIASGAGYKACAVKCCDLDRSVAAGGLNPPRSFGDGCKTLESSSIGQKDAHNKTDCSDPPHEIPKTDPRHTTLPGRCAPSKQNLVW